MIKPITIFLLLPILLLVCCCNVSASVQAQGRVEVELVELDPGTESALGNDEKLYLMLRYDSDVPLRFQTIALRDGSPLEVGAIKNPGVLHPAGTGEALATLFYTNPTRIDTVRITALDKNWRELYQVDQKVNMTWQAAAALQQRQPAEWVGPLLKQQKRLMDYFYDPAPKKYGTLYDIGFYLSVASIPIYILMQLQMLRRYRRRWRELAAIPLIPYMILAFYMVVGLEIDTALEVTFLFRYASFAFAYLLVLSLVKRLWKYRLLPAKSYNLQNS